MMGEEIMQESPGQYELICHTLEAHGVEPTDSAVEQMGVFMECMVIFHDRNTGRYRDLWKSQGWKGTLVHLASKTLRIRDGFWKHDGEGYESEEDPSGFDLDDYFDAINYVVFTIRNLRDKNRTGNDA